MSTRVLPVLVPGGVGDPRRPSGGNTYDLRVCAALREDGWRVRQVEVEAGWPWSAAAGAEALARALADLPDGAAVLVDGLLASRLPQVVVPAARRLLLVLLVHLPAGVEDPAARIGEQQVVGAAVAVVATSAWCRDWLVAHYGVTPSRVRVARPGVDPADLATGTPDGTSLLVVGAVGRAKGHDRVLAALHDVRDLDWRCRWVGPTAGAGSLGPLPAGTDRVELSGVLAGGDLEAVWDRTDLLVVASRVETYGMVVTEALARGVPVVALAVGGVAEALDRGGGARPGVLVPPDDPSALGRALRTWLTGPDHRAGLRAAARGRRPRLPGWAVTAVEVAAAVREADRGAAA